MSLPPPPDSYEIEVINEDTDRKLREYSVVANDSFGSPIVVVTVSEFKRNFAIGRLTPDKYGEYKGRNWRQHLYTAAVYELIKHVNNSSPF